MMENKSLAWPQSLILGIALASLLLKFILLLIFSFLSSVEELANTLATNPIPNIFFELIGLVITVAVISLYQTTINTQKIVWDIKPRHLAHLLTAIIVPISLVSLVISIGKAYSIVGMDHSSYAPFFYLILMLVVAFHEEFLFRFIPLISGNYWVNYLLSSFLFTLAHIFSSTDLVFLTNVFLFSLLISFGTWTTKNMVFPVVFHFTWNCLSGLVLGFPGGIDMETWYKTNVSLYGYYDPNIGIESSIILTYILLAILFLIALYLYLKRFKYKT